MISVGPKVRNVFVDNVIMFHDRAGMDIIINNKIYKVLGKSEIYAVVTEE